MTILETPRLRSRHRLIARVETSRQHQRAGSSQQRRRRSVLGARERRLGLIGRATGALSEIMRRRPAGKLRRGGGFHLDGRPKKGRRSNRRRNEGGERVYRAMELIRGFAKAGMNCRRVSCGSCYFGPVGCERHCGYGICVTCEREVKVESTSALDEVAKFLKATPTLKLYVVGQTDNTGSLAANLDLSKKRAAAVVDILRPQEIRHRRAGLPPPAFGGPFTSSSRLKRFRRRPRLKPSRRVGDAVSTAARRESAMVGSHGPTDDPLPG